MATATNIRPCRQQHSRTSLFVQRFNGVRKIVNTKTSPPWSSIILAADRTADDPLLRDAGVTAKALLEIDGTPMILRVLEALRQSDEIDSYLLAGPSRNTLQQLPALNDLLVTGQIDWLENQATPSASAYNAMQTIDSESPILVTTADHPLLNSEIVDYFCRHACNSGLDLAVGITTFERIQTSFPKIKKTVLRFKDGNYCGCNLFAFLSPQARQVADYWRQVETQRKKPLRVVGLLGWSAVLRYLLGQLSLADGMQGLSQRLHLRIGAIYLPFAEAAIDVDTLSDRRLVEATIKGRKR